MQVRQLSVIYLIVFIVTDLQYSDIIEGHSSIQTI